MRRVHKSANIPASLANVVPPVSTADIKDSLYKSQDVKAQLIADQYSKCAYCECFLNGDYGSIEHFRPKRGYSIPPGHKLITPGYYWLAYDWTNLLLSCSKCNISFKANHFALADESMRDIKGRNISNEDPLLINPSIEDPLDYITFHQHILVPRVIDGVESAKGRYTIDLLQLNNRSHLVQYRRKKWETFQYLRNCVKIAVPLIKQGNNSAISLLATTIDEMINMADETAEYSAMFINFVNEIDSLIFE